MNEYREALCIKAEVALWRARRTVYQQRVEQLKNRYILEQDDVERIEDSFFARWRKNYEATLGKEKAEALKAKLELERVEGLVRDAGEKYVLFSGEAERYTQLWEKADQSEWSETEKELCIWCEEMELAEAAATANNSCLMMLSGELKKFHDGKEDEKELIYLQERVSESYRAAENFLEAVGRLRKMPGTPIKTVRGERRVMDGGYTMLFMRWEHPPVELRMRNFDFAEVKGGLHISEALHRLRGDLEELHELFVELIEEKTVSGEALLGRLEQ